MEQRVSQFVRDAWLCGVSLDELLASAAGMHMRDKLEIIRREYAELNTNFRMALERLEWQGRLSQ